MLLGNLPFNLNPPSVSEMLLFLYEDEHGWIYEPHGEEAQCYNLAFEGSELLRAAGWCYISMHRVSRYLHESFLIDGLLVPFGW